MTRTLRDLRSAVLLLVLVAAAAVAGCRGQAPDVTGQVLPAGDATDDLVITFGSDPDPMSRGANAVVVTVARRDGTPVTDGTVTAVFSMPAMPAMNMPAMRTEAPLQHEGDGRYQGTSDLSMGGTWNVAITVTSGAGSLATRRTSIVAKE